MEDHLTESSSKSEAPTQHPAQKRRWLYIGLAGACLMLAILDIAVGSVRIPLTEAVQSLVGRASRPEWITIVQIFRLPKMLTAMLAGIGLSVSGLILQSIFRNPLAAPDSLGIGAGASIGVAVVMFLGSSIGAFGAGA
jgi:iron complex transport system permease protein